MILSDEYKYVLDELEKTNHNLFVTGKAGTGKSTLLQLFKHTTKKKIVVLAPTGIAALNVGGQTIHSFFGFPPRIIQKNEIKKRYQTKIYKNIDVLVIDEISMVRADVIDNIDYFLRLNREVNRPFGGVQVVFFGDLFQLPPVIATPEEQYYFSQVYASPYYFDAKVIKAGDIEITNIELQKIYRQEERHFIRLLDAVRSSRIDQDDLDDLNVRHFPLFEPEDYYITLSTRNAIVDQINERELQQINEPELQFQAEITGAFDLRQYPADAVLRLKEGAQVMFVKNDPKREYVNGTIGKILQITQQQILISIEDKDLNTKTIEVEKATWEILKYKQSEKDLSKIETEVIGSFKQYPLRLAWAITIHKSQGKTFDKVIIDMGSGAFEHGQTYVALSRCRTLGGIVLKQKLRPQDIMVDERIVEYYETFF